MLFHDPAQVQALEGRLTGDDAAPRFEVRVRVAQASAADRLLEAVVRRRLADAGLDVAWDDAPSRVRVPFASEAVRRTVECVLEPLLGRGLITIELRPLALA